MTKFRERCHELNFEAFDYRVRIIFTSNVVGSRTKRDSLLGRYDGASALAMHDYVPDKAQSYLFLPLDAAASTIAHECWHVVRRMLALCGAGLDNEVVAYHLGHLVGEVHKFQKRSR
jgi:hypothetical protein